jgi:Tfp pilus assembly PilM family ATPase
MSNSIYCSPSHLKLVSGDADAKSIKVRKYAEINLPEGGMLGGIITDEEVMTRFFSHVNNDYELGKEPTFLVINNNNIQAKSLEVPPVSEDMILEFVEREYSQHDEGDSEKNVYDYTVLTPNGPSGGAQILAVGAPRDILAPYRRTLVAAGFDLKRIDIALHSQIKLVQFLPQLQEGSIILAIVDRRMLTLTLFENGNYRVSNRHRLVHSDGDAEWADEISSDISQVIQFNKTQKDCAAVTAVYIAGLDEALADTLRASAGGYLGIDIKRLDMSGHISLRKGAGQGECDSFDAGKYIFNIGNLLKNAMR